MKGTQTNGLSKATPLAEDTQEIYLHLNPDAYPRPSMSQDWVKVRVSPTGTVDLMATEAIVVIPLAGNHIQIQLAGQEMLVERIKAAREVRRIKAQEAAEDRGTHVVHHKHPG